MDEGEQTTMDEAKEKKIRKKENRWYKDKLTKVENLLEDKKYRECLDYITLLGDKAMLDSKISEAKVKCLSIEVDKLFNERKFIECLDCITLFGDAALNERPVYEAKVLCLAQLKRFQEALEVSAEAYGHQETYLTIFSKAICNFECGNYEATKTLFNKIDLTDIDDEKSNQQYNYIMKTIHENLGERLAAKAEENSDLSQQNEEEFPENGANKPTDLSRVVDGSSSTVALSCPAVVDSSVACSSTTQAFLSHKTPELVEAEQTMDGAEHATVDRKTRQKLKKWFKEKSQRVEKLVEDNKYSECLEYITLLGDKALHDRGIYESKVYCFSKLGRFQEGLVLSTKDYGHQETSLRFDLSKAVCNFKCGNYEAALTIFSNNDLANIPDIKEILKIIHEKLGVAASAEENADLYEQIEELPENAPDKPTSNLSGVVDGSSSAVALSCPAVVDSSYLSGSGVVDRSTLAVGLSCPAVVDSSPLDKPNSSAEEELPEDEAVKPTDFSGVIDGSSSAVTLSCPAFVDSLVACSSTTQAFLSQKTPELVFSEKLSFDMNKVDKQSYVGLMNIGGRSFRKTLIIANEKKLKDLDGSTCEAFIEMKGNPFILKHEFLVYSSVLSSHLHVVESVCSVKVFFDQKLDAFKKQIIDVSREREEWWTFICESFNSIFRDIIRGLFAIHSTQKICGDLDTSMYVTEGGQGKILYISGEKFSKSQSQKDVDDLLFSMESVVSLIRPRPRKEKHVWLLQEFEDDYKLPTELIHFFRSLEKKKLVSHKIPTTWLIDHPYFWPPGHLIDFIRILNEVFRVGLIDGGLFCYELTRFNTLTGWKSKAFKDGLLKAIYCFKGDKHYNSGNESAAVSFALAIINHVNDTNYTKHRGLTQYQQFQPFTRDDIAKLIETVLPSLSSALYDAIFVYADICHDEHTLLLQAL